MSARLRNVLMFMLYPAGMVAQDTTGNVFSEQFQQRYNFFAKEAISQPLLYVQDYSLIKGGFRYTSGKYALSQDAASQKDIFFYTEGSRKVKKIWVSGLFAYQRTVQDSVGNTLRYGLHDATPFYFYAAKKGNWEISKYQLQGIASTSLLHEKLNIGMGVSYNAANAWRSRDPRPEYFEQDMQAGLTAHYRLFPRQLLGMEGTIINKNTETNIEFRSLDYSSSLAYPEYITYLQYGYGFGALHVTNRALIGKTNGWKLQGIYHGRFNIGELTLKGGYTNQVGKFYRSLLITDPGAQYGRFYEDIVNASLYWTLKRKQRQWSATVEYYNHLGRDFNVILNGNNYVYSLEQLSILPLYARTREHKIIYELGIPLSFSNLFRADGTAGQLTNYQHLNTAVTGAYYHYTASNEKWWKARLQLGIQVPIAMERKESVMQTAFSKQVIYPDYLYYNATSLTAKAEWTYNFLIGKTRTFFRVDGQYQQASIKQDHDYPAIAKPGNSRWYIQTSIGISL